ncbi:AAA family ATPase [Candidatus Parcubacteria bacterium]|nr:MAG: AAA family ATPase [Candidatus Parcubacteria bacterium]
MSEKIQDILKKTVQSISSGKPPSPSNVAPRSNDLPGDPSCEICGGLGYVRQDVPVGHPDFGKLHVCPCRQGDINRERRERLYALSNLDRLQHMTFDSFDPQGRHGIGPAQINSLKQALSLARQFAEKPQGWLLLQGRYGCGKTHLAAAIANFVVDLGVPTLFITVPDLLDQLRYAFSTEGVTFEERFEEIRRVRLLILDDFGTQNATPWAQEKLFQILNYRYINQLPTVITTNLVLEEIEGRIRSRLSDPDLVAKVVITAPDYRQPMDVGDQSDLSILQHLAGKTFGNFSLRRSENISKSDLERLERAFHHAQQFAKQPDGWLVLTGGYGSGKTHLAAAIGNYRVSMGTPALMVMVPDLMDYLRATFNPQSPIRYSRLFEEVRSTPLLILDDLSSQAMTPWVKEKLYQLFNYRYNAVLPTVITTHSIADMNKRIRTRLEDPSICVIHHLSVPPYRGMRGKPQRY